MKQHMYRYLSLLFFLAVFRITLAFTTRTLNMYKRNTDTHVKTAKNKTFTIVQRKKPSQNNTRLFPAKLKKETERAEQ